MKSFRSASDLLTCQKSAAELLKNQKEAVDNEKKLFRSAAELLKSQKEAVDSVKKKRESTTDEEVSDIWFFFLFVATTFPNKKGALQMFTLFFQHIIFC